MSVAVDYALRFLGNYTVKGSIASASTSDTTSSGSGNATVNLFPFSLPRRLMAISNMDSGSIGAIPLPTTRVELPPIADQASVVDTIAGVYQRVALNDLVESYRDLEQAMRGQTRRGDQLE